VRTLPQQSVSCRAPTSCQNLVLYAQRPGQKGSVAFVRAQGWAYYAIAFPADLADDTKRSVANNVKRIVQRQHCRCSILYALATGDDDEAVEIQVTLVRSLQPSARMHVTASPASARQMHKTEDALVIF
jgi:hypothetical protein